MKKVLVVTYYWPPAGGPGVQRWLNFVTYLKDFGLEPVVYIPENPVYPLVDDTFLKDIPKDLKIYKKPIFEPYRLASIFSRKKTKRISAGIIRSENQSLAEKIMLWVRGNFFIPDARKYWVKPSVRFLKDIIANEGINHLITTGPPHSIHLIGYYLKKDTRIQWITDFRDPWTSIGYHKKLKLTVRSQKKHKALEKLILTSADKIVVTSKTTMKEFQLLTDVPIKVITNGFQQQLKTPVEVDANFTISHIGSLLSGRNPEILWKVIAALTKENDAFRNKLALQFVGIVSQEVLDTLARYDLTHYCKVLGYVSHEKAIAYQQKSQLLLLVEIDSHETVGIIPGKLFEYMAANRPIIALGPKGWEVASMISDTKTGAVFEYTEETQLKQALLTYFDAYVKGDLTLIPQDIEQYRRKELTKKLVEFIEWE